MVDKLTDKQKRFCDEYLVDLNATQAYIRAGYAVKDESVAKVNACRLLTNANAVTYIAERQKKRSDKVEWTAEEILRDIKSIAKDVNNEIRDRLKAYELGGKHIGMWTDKVESKVTSENLNVNVDLPAEDRKARIDELLKKMQEK